jgi:excisionase family DNA binding protein
MSQDMPERMENQKMTLKPLYTIPEAATAYGISRSRIYILLAEGTLTAKKMGKRTLLTCESLQQYADNLPTAKFGNSKAAA